MAYQTINPYTNEVVKTYPNATDTEIKSALEVTGNLYETMKTQKIEDRAVILHRIADQLRANEDELAKIATTDMGKLFRESKGEVELCALIADYFADHAGKMLQPTELKSQATGHAYVEKQATGVLMMVEPWNFPYYQIMRVFAPNFMVGNPMILKGASNTPGSSEAFEKMVQQAGAPEGSLVNLWLSYDQIGQIIADKRVQGVALTGSERGGRAVAVEAAQNLKKTSMELGGMDAFVVLDDANMADVTDIAWRARLYNDGQVCTSSKRFIVMDNVYDEFLKQLKTNFSRVKMGDPMANETSLAPMNTKRAKAKLQDQVDDAVKNGAHVYYGNEPVDLPGQFFMPTILTDITPDNPAYRTEMFGPVAQVYKVSSEAEAIKLANDSEFGLGGIVFSGDTKRGERVASQIETGMVFVNNFMTSLPELPFGGIKKSGYGREMSELGLMAFVNEKLIVATDKPNLNNLAGGLVATD
ncbi:NAD-dependent succinate-semialdehyde dehydrogenase [Levilactobacillus bambusae]|uniref:Succinate-semialdehyde dehydrogenase n=1 Tax=Levilactobacillus bambusae TaxID=2024736 RepID=A0A2V1MX89_9LACO|nr:NAD-dependent succinate-semialdehyde dehydrogenase [Levilactobacillus bambusae]PWF99680.1 succinate-semialdehyde dehydrogenase [Levilactobacillus bambusae]